MNLEETERILDSPRESLAIELKDWFDPSSDEGRSKLIKAAIAMRNNDGGIIIIGVTNEGKLNKEKAPDNVEQIFNFDDIQGLIAKHSSESFEIGISFPEKEGKKFIVISIPSGVKTPVAIKKPLIANGKNIIEQDVVYVRSLDANNTPSTTKATHKDWHRITEICFENREADIGRFLRRHLANATNVKDLIDAFFEARHEKDKTVEERVTEFLDESIGRYNAIITERKLAIPEHGAMEVAAIINGKSEVFSANSDFRDLILSKNPDYTGWPMWVDSRSFSDGSSRPYVHNQFWESMIAFLNSGWHDALDFWRISPQGRFYLYRALQDDIGGGRVGDTRLKTLDFGLTVLRVAEAIAVAIAFAKAMGAAEELNIYFGFRWTGLKDRVLSSWANPSRDILARKSYQNEVVSYVDVPVNVPKSALYTYVHKANKNVFEIFDGFLLSESVTEDLVARLLERKL